jgi:hypothetical protein
MNISNWIQGGVAQHSVAETRQVVYSKVSLESGGRTALQMTLGGLIMDGSWSGFDFGSEQDSRAVRRRAKIN